MKKYLKSALTLFLICAFFAFLLSLVYSFTKDKIAANAKAELISGLKDVITEENNYSVDEEISVTDSTVKSYFVVRGSSNNVTSFVLSLVGSGYGGEFTVIASYSLDGELLRVKLLDNSETSGLGKKYEDQSKLKMFNNTNNIPSSKADLTDDFRTIVTGASITFEGISKAVSAGQMFVKQNLREVR